MSFFFDSKYQSTLVNGLRADWLPNGSIVSILQGFPGTGKSSIARSLAENIEIDTFFWEMNEDSVDLFGDFFVDLANDIDLEKFDLLSTDLDRGKKPSQLQTIVNVIKKHPLLIVIENFQFCIAQDAGLPSKEFQVFFDKLNRLSSAAGKILLISNRKIKRELWNERCYSVGIEGFSKEERVEFFVQALSASNLSEKVPSARIYEIASRLGGNPRAILTLISCLFYDTIEDLLSLSPELFEIGDESISITLIVEFENQLVKRSISSIDSCSRDLLQYLSVYRKPFKNVVYEKIPTEDAGLLRNELIGRYFIHNTIRGDFLHPVARQVFVSQIQQNAELWGLSNNLASDYYLASFRMSDKTKNSTLSSSYSELRHHLTQCNRISDICYVSSKLRNYLLSNIGKPQQSEVPKNREILEERIALLSLMSDGERPKGLEYHLAICLRERNKDGDFKKALHHIRLAESPDIYYAAWLVRLDLEYSVEGVDSMYSAFQESLNYLKQNNNVFAVFRRCAEIFHQNGNIQKAIEVLELGIEKSGVHCYTSIAPLCADYMIEKGETGKAVALLLRCIATPGVTRVVTLYGKCADLMVAESRYDEARELLEKALSIPSMTKVYSLRLQLSGIIEKTGDRKAAINSLKYGLTDSRGEDTKILLLKCAELMISDGELADAISLLEKGVNEKKGLNQGELIVSLADKLSKAGNYETAINVLTRAYSEKSSFDKKIICLKLAELYFSNRDLDRSAMVLRNAISNKKIIDKWDFYDKYADILYRQGHAERAMEVLKNGVNDVNCSNTYVLYKAGAKILTKEGKLNDAKIFLEDGSNSSSVKDKAALHQELAKLLERNGELNSAIEVLEKTIHTPGMKGLPRLYKSCAEIHERNCHPEKAISMLEQGILDIPYGNIAPLYKLAAEILYRMKNISYASYFLEQGLERYPKDKSLKWFSQHLHSDEFLSKFSLKHKSELAKESTAQEAIRKIEYFKHIIEFQDCYKTFYDNKGLLTANEVFVQYLFKMVWAETISSVDSEVKNGRGIVDFKISRGKLDSTLVEFKLASNSSLKRNLENQTEIYELVNQTRNSFTVIMVFSAEDSSRVKNVLQRLGKQDNEKIHIIDARRDNKPSASVAKVHK